MNRIGIGRTAEVFEIDNEQILKLFYDGISAESVTGEYAISEALSRKIPNMPKVYELVTEGNRRGIVFQRIQGSHMARVMLKNPAAIPELVRKFSLLHKSILAVDLQGETLDLANVTDVIERCRESRQLTEQEEDIVERFLTASDTKQLCHGDFHPENVLVDSDGTLWIIDWITVVLCNGMFDIARTYYLLRYAQSPEKKPTLVRIVERIACTYISRAYHKNMIGSREDKKMLVCFFFIMLLMRTGEGIPEEQGTLARLIRTKKNTALKEMQRYLNG
ncbi:MAG TPA: aminoglycoside phosphotransferase family protein [Treponemataceae bacterium]|nr:aminoglycoside phosphotransferase family protein [Treponemataceae bacterium]